MHRYCLVKCECAYFDEDVHGSNKCWDSIKVSFRFLTNLLSVYSFSNFENLGTLDHRKSLIPILKCLFFAEIVWLIIELIKINIPRKTLNESKV